MVRVILSPKDEESEDQLIRQAQHEKRIDGVPPRVILRKRSDRRISKYLTPYMLRYVQHDDLNLESVALQTILPTTNPKDKRIPVKRCV